MGMKEYEGSWRDVIEYEGLWWNNNGYDGI